MKSQAGGSKPLVVKLTAAEADAIVQVGVALEELGLAKRNTPGWHFDKASLKIEEAGANQQRNDWDRCDKCNGAGIVER